MRRDHLLSTRLTQHLQSCSQCQYIVDCGARSPTPHQLYASVLITYTFRTEDSNNLPRSTAAWTSKLLSSLLLCCVYILTTLGSVLGKISNRMTAILYNADYYALFTSLHVHDIGSWYLPLGTCRWVRRHNSACFSTHSRSSSSLANLPAPGLYATCLIHSRH